MATPMAAAAATCTVPRLSTRCNDSRSAEVSTDEQSDAAKPRMRRSRLFKNSQGFEPRSAAAPAQEPAKAGPPVSEEFRRAFEELGVKPVDLNKLSRVSCCEGGSFGGHMPLVSAQAPTGLRLQLLA